jgi:hypothetical protein
MQSLLTPAQPGRIAEPTPEYVTGQTVVSKIHFEHAILTTEAEVDEYAETVRKAMIEEIKKGKRIQI